MSEQSTWRKKRWKETNKQGKMKQRKTWEGAKQEKREIKKWSEVEEK